MDEYIRREDAYTTLTDYYHHSTETQHMALKEALGRVPAAEVVPTDFHDRCMQIEIAKRFDLEKTKRKTGRWINYLEDGFVECPFCHSATNCDGEISELHYCFNCGAQMIGGDEDA